MTDVLVPDMGSDDPVDIAEILVKAGDTVAVEDSLVVLESSKASVEVPSPVSGVIDKIHATVGQSLKTGDLLMTLSGAESQAQDIVAEQPQVLDTGSERPTSFPAPKESSSASPNSINTCSDIDVLLDADHTFELPDIGGETADVIELSVQPGANVKKDQTLLVLESAKATVEVPAESDGVLVKYLVSVGDSVELGQPFVVMTLAQASSSAAARVPMDHAPSHSHIESNLAPQTFSGAALKPNGPSESATSQVSVNNDLSLDVNLSSNVHAGPAVRRLANKLGVPLNQVHASGPRGRILKEDVEKYVKSQMLQPRAPSSGGGLEPLPEINFSQFGPVESVPLSKIQQVSAKNLHRAWVNIPHVTQFDEADVTDLEKFRKSLGEEYKTKGIKITMLAFLVKASTLALQKFPKFNASLHTDGKTLIQKQYCHIGFAADTPHGLVVPVIRNADQLSVAQIAEQLGVLSTKAREKKLGPKEMQGGCFSISSLGGIGGTAFTPIVNWPEVAILGVSRSKMQPTWDGQNFVPRLILPLSLSYDHRVIDGADAARFTQYVAQLLTDSRRMIL